MFFAQTAALALGAFFTASCLQNTPTRDDLSQTEVMNIPAGNATGTGFTDTYMVTRTTRACMGSCLAALGPLAIRLCRVDESVMRSVNATQANGAIVFMVENETPSTLRGGIDGDGTFDVGGATTGDYGNVTARVEGTISNRMLVANGRSRTVGSYMNQPVDCIAVYDIATTR